MTTSDIDLNFRPLSYFWPRGLASHLLATVKGAERRAMLQRLIDSDRLDFLTEFLAKSDLSREERTSVPYPPDIHQRRVPPKLPGKRS
jgi:hypothetical protein